MRGSTKLIKSKEFIVFWYWDIIEARSNCMVNEISEYFSVMRLGVEVSKFHIRSCVHRFNFFRRISSWRALISTPRGLDWGVILSAKTLLIVAWLSYYNFDGVPMGCPIGLKKFLIQFWSYTPVFIALVYTFELLPEVSDFFLAQQYMRVLLKLNV